MARATFLLFALLVYVIFFATFLYLVAFVGGFPVVPTGLDHGIASGTASALIIDLLLIVSFGLQHSVMARQGFKAMWTRIVPAPIERSVYVLSASLVLIMLMTFWHPIGPVLWHVNNQMVRIVLWSIFAAGWGIVLLSTFLLNHFELFGISQVVNNMRGKQAAAPQLRQPLFYKLVRHPLYTGFLLAFWSTPHMSAGHLLFSAGMTIYVLIAIRHEERDLVDMFGADYEQYRQGVGMVIPGLGRTG